ncbi:MAG TPA: hypothetical protein VFS54_12335 [Solirubrobacterales bacterium]|nr:hypothetical protein [Solirubrobacterales bacterium]
MIAVRGGHLAAALGLLLLLWAIPAAGAASPEDAPEELRPVQWVLDTDKPPPKPKSKFVAVAVHEMGCASGRNPLPHLDKPEVRYGKRGVVITLRIDPPDGAQLCPSNPVGHLRVRLPGPLGKRKLYDGADEPPRKVEYGEDPQRPGKLLPGY